MRKVSARRNHVKFTTSKVPAISREICRQEIRVELYSVSVRAREMSRFQREIDENRSEAAVTLTRYNRNDHGRRFIYCT